VVCVAEHAGLGCLVAEAAHHEHAAIAQMSLALDVRAARVRGVVAGCSARMLDVLARRLKVAIVPAVPVVRTRPIGVPFIERVGRRCAAVVRAQDPQLQGTEREAWGVLGHWYVICGTGRLLIKTRA